MSSKHSKISQATKDGLDGTKHVTRLHNVPGLIRLTDKPVPVSPPKIEAMKFKSSLARVENSADFDEEVDVNSAVRKGSRKYNRHCERICW
ncbi:hypothetical protein Hanom_Chr08g00730941 [Helianthus anomalus]